MPSRCSARRPQLAKAPAAARKGGSIGLRITTARHEPYTIDVFRLGYYHGKGGRLVEHLGPFPQLELLLDLRHQHPQLGLGRGPFVHAERVEADHLPAHLDASARPSDGAGEGMHRIRLAHRMRADERDLGRALLPNGRILLLDELSELQPTTKFSYDNQDRLTSWANPAGQRYVEYKNIYKEEVASGE